MQVGYDLEGKTSNLDVLDKGLEEPVVGRDLGKEAQCNTVKHSAAQYNQCCIVI